MITLKYDDGGVERSLDVLVDSVSDLKPIFARFTKYMRGQVDETFKSQNDGTWPERTEESVERQKAEAPQAAERIKAQQLNSLRGRLRGERLKSQKLLAKTPSGSKLGARRQRALERKEATAAEFERVAAGGERSTDKAHKSLYKRLQRREDKSADLVARLQKGDAPLGRIAQSISVHFEKATWEMFSRIEWAGAHNEGANVGRGGRTKLPKREFLFWTPERVEKFAEIAQQYMTEKFAKASKGSESK